MALRIMLGSYTVILIINLLSKTILGSSLTISSATLTTLPPASPTGNSTDPCNFTDRYSLIDRVDADWRGYNLSLLIATCEGVCPLIYGAGNPDISGIGAMASYIIQAVITFFFGPILALLCIIYNIDLSTQSSEPLERHSRLWSLAGNLSQSAQTGNILTSLAVLTASIIRIQQLAPVAEINFIKTLALYQFMMSFAISASYMAVFGKSIRFYLLAFYAAAIYGMYMATLFMNGYPSSKVTLLDTITWYCVLDWDYPIPDLYVDEEGDNKFDLIFLLSYTGFWIVLGIAAYLIAKYLGAWLLRFYNALRDSFVALCERLHVNPRRLLSSLSIISLTALWVSFIVLSLLGLQWQRQRLQLVSGNSYQDSQWGFGQITAVLLWAPICSDIILGIFEYVYLEPLPTQPETHEMQPLEAAPTLDLLARPQSAHLRNFNPHSTSGSMSRDDSNNNPRRLSQETLIGRELGDSDLENTSNQSAISSGAEPVAAPISQVISSPTGASPSGNSRHPLDRATENIGVHQRPSWPHNESGTYLPVRSP